MIEKTDLLCCADAYMALTGIAQDKTLSYRMFGDSKRLADLRGSGDITVSRFNNAMVWLLRHWPEGAERPAVLDAYAPSPAPLAPPSETSGRDALGDAA